jgi:propanol-preferring alcohol dehydrogenase
VRFVIVILLVHARRVGEENPCDKVRSLGICVDGGYVEYVLIPNYRYLVKIEDDVDIDTSAPLSCVGLAEYGAVKNVFFCI